MPATKRIQNQMEELTVMNFMRASKAAGLAALLAAAIAAAQPFPDKPVRMIVPLPPGTASDFLARTLGQTLSDAYKQQVVVDNRPGAGGLIGSGIVAKATPDGYTLAMVAPPHLVGPLLQSNPPYRPLDDFAAVIEVASLPNIVVVAASVPAKNVQELIALIKSKPGQFNFGSAGIGTAAHLGAEILNRAGGLKAVHIPFKLIPDVLTEMSAGRVHYVVFTAPAALTLLRGDAKLRAIAVTGAKRSAAFPDLPTVAEAGLPEAVSDVWFGIIAPASTPRRIVAQLNADIVKILRVPETKEKFARQGAELADDTTPEGFSKLLKSEYVRYQKLIKDAGLKQQ
jgi:tripartite-type tricarboxylate transporter receptor subunit TctC